MIRCTCSKETCPTCSGRARPAEPQAPFIWVLSAGTDVAPENSGSQDRWIIQDDLDNENPDGDEDDDGDY